MTNEAELRLAARALCKIRGWHEAPHQDGHRCVESCQCGARWMDYDREPWGWSAGDQWRWPAS